jgi:hypothetical protein
LKQEISEFSHERDLDKKKVHVTGPDHELITPATARPSSDRNVVIDAGGSTNAKMSTDAEHARVLLAVLAADILAGFTVMIAALGAGKETQLHAVAPSCTWLHIVEQKCPCLITVTAVAHSYCSCTQLLQLHTVTAVAHSYCSCTQFHAVVGKAIYAWLQVGIGFLLSLFFFFVY